MFGIIKFLVYFSISFCLLSIPVGNKKVFYHIDEMASPHLRPIFSKASQSVKEQLSKIKIFGLYVFDQSKSKAKDTVSLGQSAPRRARKKTSDSSELERKSEIAGIEFYSDEEVRKLQEMLRNSQY